MNDAQRTKMKERLFLLAYGTSTPLRGQEPTPKDQDSSGSYLCATGARVLHAASEGVKVGSLIMFVDPSDDKDLHTRLVEISEGALADTTDWHVKNVLEMVKAHSSMIPIPRKVVANKLRSWFTEVHEGNARLYLVPTMWTDPVVLEDIGLLAARKGHNLKLSLGHIRDSHNDSAFPILIATAPTEDQLLTALREAMLEGSLIWE